MWHDFLPLVGPTPNGSLSRQSGVCRSVTYARLFFSLQLAGGLWRWVLFGAVLWPNAMLRASYRPFGPSDSLSSDVSSGRDSISVVATEEMC